MDIVVAYQGRELEGSDKFKIRPRPRIQVKKFMRTVVSNLQDTTAFTSARIRPVQEKLEVSKVGIGFGTGFGCGFGVQVSKVVLELMESWVLSTRLVVGGLWPCEASLELELRATLPRAFGGSPG